MNELRLRPLTLGDIFDEGFDLYKRHLPLLMLTAALVVVPLQAAAAWVSLQFTGTLRGLNGVFGGTDFPDLSQLWARIGDAVGALAIYFPLYVIGYGLMTAALASASASAYLGEPVTVGRVYGKVLRRGHVLAGTALLWGLAVGTGYLVCFVGAILPLTWYALSAHVFSVEGKGYAGALKRSANLVSGHGGRLWGALLLLGLISWVATLGVQLPLAYALDTVLRSVPGGESWLGGGSFTGGTGLRRQMVGSVSGGIAELFAAPFLICTLTVFYFDLRVRKEAWDVERLAQGLGYANGAMPPGFPPPVEPPPLRLPPRRAIKPNSTPKRGAA